MINEWFYNFWKCHRFIIILTFLFQVRHFTQRPPPQLTLGGESLRWLNCINSTGIWIQMHSDMFPSCIDDLYTQITSTECFFQPLVFFKPSKLKSGAQSFLNFLCEQWWQTFGIAVLYQNQKCVFQKQQLSIKQTENRIHEAYYVGERGESVGLRAFIWWSG